MKAGVVTGAAIFGGFLVTIAGGHPHELKRALVTEVVLTTITVANVVVYVDENGSPLQTSTVSQATTALSNPAQTTYTTISVTAAEPSAALFAEQLGMPASTSSPASSSSQDLSSSDVYPVLSATQQAESTTPETTPEAVVATSSAPPPASPSDNVAEAAYTTPSAIVSPSAIESSTTSSDLPSSSAASSTSSPISGPETAADGDAFPIGITYDPFKPGDCKSEQEITNDWQKMKSYGIVRVYGMACNIIPISVRLAKANNQRLMAGIWLNNDDAGEDPLEYVDVLAKAVRDHAGGNWNIIALVAVENERVNDRVFTASHVVDATNRTRQALRAAYYGGPVGAVETVPAMLDNPMVCESSDIALVNVHSFFDAHCNAEGTGQFVKDQVARVRERCGGKRVVVTEAGWPHTGDSHDNAVPSRDNQRKAIDSLLREFKNDLFLFNAFDSMWKSNWAGTFNAEQFWGILQ